MGCWFAGCGCLVVVAFIGLFAFAGLGGVLGLSDSESAPSPSVETTPESDDAADLTEHLELYEQERTRIDELSVALDGNPVKPLVALFDWMEDQDAKMAEPNVTVCSAESIAAQMSTFRADLEQSIADAEARWSCTSCRQASSPSGTARSTPCTSSRTSSCTGRTIRMRLGIVGSVRWRRTLSR